MSEHLSSAQPTFSSHCLQSQSMENHRKRRQHDEYPLAEMDAPFTTAVANSWGPTQAREYEQLWQPNVTSLSPQPSTSPAIHNGLQHPHHQQLAYASEHNPTSGSVAEVVPALADQMHIPPGQPAIPLSLSHSSLYASEPPQDMSMFSSDGFQKGKTPDDRLGLHTPLPHERDPGNHHRSHPHLPSWPDHPADASFQKHALSPTTPTFFTPTYLAPLQEDVLQSSGYDSFRQEGPSPFDWSQPPPMHVASSFSDATAYPTTVLRQGDLMNHYNNEAVRHPPTSLTICTETVDQSPPSSPLLKPFEAMAIVSPPVTPMYGRLSNISLPPDSALTSPSSTVGPSRVGYFPCSSVPNQHALVCRDQFSVTGMPDDPIAPTPSSAAPKHPAIGVEEMNGLIQNYLHAKDPLEAGQRTIVIMTSKVAQKSYGTEKRFLCPPPMAFLIGPHWWTAKQDGMATVPLDNEQQQSNTEENSDGLTPPKVSIRVSSESIMQPAQIEWYGTSGAIVGRTGTGGVPPSGQDASRKSTSRYNGTDWYRIQDNDTLASGRCVSKNLYISDGDDKRKRVECVVYAQLANGLTLSPTVSRGIKVISKPSKKRQSIKNMDLCIHHGMTIALFNRIRSQTVSTKYLGVSTANGNMPLAFLGRETSSTTPESDGTCFIARTSAWDPFVIWVVDDFRSLDDCKRGDERAEDYIGRNCTNTAGGIRYPPPPAIAVKNESDEPLPVHYNQKVVLQCLSTGLVSPVMVIRRVDKASTVVGGAQPVFTDPSTPNGGEFGDEVLGDPVSQLHKVAFQIVQPIGRPAASPLEPMPFYQPQDLLPRSSSPVSYLACQGDVVSVHRTRSPRTPIQPQTLSWEEMTSQEGGRVVRKRRVSTDIVDRQLVQQHRLVPSMSMTHMGDAHLQQERYRRRVNSMSDGFDRLQHAARTQSGTAMMSDMTGPPSEMPMSAPPTGRRVSVDHVHPSTPVMDTYWQEDASDAAVWTIVGTDCTSYTFWIPPQEDPAPVYSSPLPILFYFSLGRSLNRVSSDSASCNALRQNPPAGRDSDLHSVSSHGSRHSNHSGGNTAEEAPHETAGWIMSLHGEYFSRDLQVWIGDVHVSKVEFRSRELVVCYPPSRQALLKGTCHEFNDDTNVYRAPILLVRGDGIVIKTNQVYQF